MVNRRAGVGPWRRVVRSKLNGNFADGFKACEARRDRKAWKHSIFSLIRCAFQGDVADPEWRLRPV
jgi:hypothetical protein